MLDLEDLLRVPQSVIDECRADVRKFIGAAEALCAFNDDELCQACMDDPDKVLYDAMGGNIVKVITKRLLSIGDPKEYKAQRALEGAVTRTGQEVAEIRLAGPNPPTVN